MQTNRIPLMALDLVIRPTKKGGLGIKDHVMWNEAAIAKYVWNVAENEDNLWVKWIDRIYLKGGDWWTHIPSR